MDDIDDMWNDIEDHTSKLIECEKRDVELTDTIQKNKEEANENIVEAVQAANVAIETLTKKLNMRIGLLEVQRDLQLLN